MVCNISNNIISYRIIFWLFVSLFFLFVEIGSPGLFLFLSFAVGAFITAFFNVFIISWTLELLIFLVISFFTLIILHYWIKSGKKEVANKKTNKGLLLQRVFVVTKKIESYRPGAIKIDGVFWLAYSAQKTVIEKNSYVKIAKVNGASVVVYEIKNN